MRYLISTLGCRLNQAESAQIEKNLLRHGLLPAENLPPDIIIINSCVVTQKAERETKKAARHYKKLYPNAALIVTGCIVNYWQKTKKHKLYQKELDINFLIKNQDKKKITKILNLRKKDKTIKIGNSRLFDKYPSGGRKILPIQSGCDNFCTYCIVPYLRPTYSYSIKDIISEIKKLEKQGIKEVILAGINISLYQPGLAKLLNQILTKTTISRIRFGSININAFSNKLIALYSKTSRLCRHFHIPAQSGSDKILKLMKRNYSTKEFIDTVKKIKAQIPDVNITTDIIVGFPGETNNDFKKTLSFCRRLCFGKIHIFRYSPRPKTPAARFKNQVQDIIKKTRAQKLAKINKTSQKKLLAAQIGKTHKVLLEEKIGEYHRGYTDNYFDIRTKNPSPYKIKIVNVKITSFKDKYLIGKII